MDRRSIAVSGIVQGVGFRPFVHDLATRLGLGGFVQNRTGDVLIELEGHAQALDRFVAELRGRPPALARIDGIVCTPRRPRGERRFRIEASVSDRAADIFIAPDSATCDDCLRELFDPADRRYRYPFLNCTNCGPRLTIITGAPYDRERTTMAGFVMCARCRAEYEDPNDRRYHAQPVACPACGPRLHVLNRRGNLIAGVDPLARAIEALRQARIVAIKSLGGYHLACDARDKRAVEALRRRKERDEKPLAVMVASLSAARGWCEITRAEQALLTSRRRPIVLLRRRRLPALPEAIAPRHPYLGVMLPYTPLHHLLMDAWGNGPLVMTSGNRSDEPIAYEDDDARERLKGIADLFLTNDRPIHMRCDDSVTRVVAGIELPIRRARGDAPAPLRLPRPCRRPTLALGGQLKATFALGRDRHAFVSHHLGDLDDYAAYRAYVEAIAHYERLFDIGPERVVHDLHPDYASTRFAAGLDPTLPRLAVQHHHAHVASVMAEHGLDEPVIGVAFDGSGYGTDGAVWGGEFFTGGYRAFRRAAHLRYVAMPGGDQAVRTPWRMAAAHLLDAGLDLGVLGANTPAHAAVARMIACGLNAPPTSSMGRLFDAVSALSNVRGHEIAYEGQAAVELEWYATNRPAAGVYPFALDAPRSDAPVVVDTRPLIRAVADDARRGCGAAEMARRFHTTVVDIIGHVCARLRQQTGVSVVVLSGGVFLNTLVTRESIERLELDGFRVYRHRRVPPGDGGLSLGQLAIAAAHDGP